MPEEWLKELKFEFNLFVNSSKLPKCCLCRTEKPSSWNNSVPLNVDDSLCLRVLSFVISLNHIGGSLFWFGLVAFSIPFVTLHDK